MNSPLPAALCWSFHLCASPNTHQRKTAALMTDAIQTAVKTGFILQQRVKFAGGCDQPECIPRVDRDLSTEEGGQWRCLWGTSSPGCTATSRASENYNADPDTYADAYHGSIIINVSPLRRDCHPLLVLCSHRAIILKDFVCRTEISIVLWSFS